MTGQNLTLCISGHLGYHLGKVIPTADALVAEVIDAGIAVILSVLYDVKDGYCQVISVCGSAYLVKHNFKLRTSGGQVEHGFYKVLPKLAIQPGSAYNDIIAAGRHYILFSMQFGKAIYACGCAFLVLTAGRIIGIAPKHIVSADMHNQSTNLFHSYGQALRSLGIEQFSKLLIGLGTIHISVSSAVDNHADTFSLNHLADSFQISDVKHGGLDAILLYHISEYIAVSTVTRNNTHFIAKLAVGSCN